MNNNVKEVPSICRVCHAQCPVTVTVEDGKATKLTGVKDHPVYHGYACAKGRALPSYHYMPERITTSLKRLQDGSQQKISSQTATQEIAAKIEALIKRYGPRSIAIYNGTHGYNNFLSTGFGFSFMEAINSPMIFTSVTIDQPGKAVSGALHGLWLAGHATIDEADCWMYIGANPIVSMLGPVNPAHALKRNKERGMKLIVVDPRRSDVARRSDIFLQPKPGHDPLILGAMLKVIFDENLQDQEFLNDHAVNVDALVGLLDELDIDEVAKQCDVSANDLKNSARTYAAAKRGVVAVGTGPNMSGHGNLTEYLSRVLMTVCGHWLREGDDFANPGVLVNPPPAIAQAVDPYPAWGFGEKLRVRNLSDTAAGLPTAALADEILMEGEGQVRALISIGGNPLLAWPDQEKTEAALKKLDLLVCLDTMPSATCQLADYVVAVKTHLEVSSLSALQEACRAYIGWGYWSPYGQYCEPAVAPPEGSDVIEEWEFFLDVATAMDKQLSIKPVSWAFYPDKQNELAFVPDRTQDPSADSLFEKMFVDSPVNLEEVKKYPDGHVFDLPKITVAAGDPNAGHLDAGNDTMLKQLSQLYKSCNSDNEFPFRLVNRRLPDIVNSSWRPNPVTQRRWPNNPAFMNPADLESLQLKQGDQIKITSDHASIAGVVESTADVKRGVISMSHCGGASIDDESALGSNTGKLTPTDRNFDPHTGIPIMSGIAVSVEAI